MNPPFDPGQSPIRKPAPDGAPPSGRRLRQSGEFHRDGKYYRFTRGTVLVVRGWPDLLAWRKTPSSPSWQRVRPELRLGEPEPIGADRTPRKQCLVRQPDFDAGEDEARNDPSISFHPDWPGWRLERLQAQLRARRWLVDTFPAGIRQRLGRFPNRQWHLAVLLARCPGAIDLVDSNPALAYALASSWCFRESPVRWPLRSARRLVRGRQRDLLTWLGFPGTESAVRTLRKVPPAACTLPILLRLRELLRDPEALPFLRHARRIHGSTVALLQEPSFRPLLTPTLLEETARRTRPDRTHPVALLLRDTLALLTALPPANPVCFLDIRSIIQCHDRLVMSLIRDRDVPDPLAWNDPPPPESSARFPDPPVPGTPSIIPLVNRQQLEEEGRQMRHCVGVYSEWVQSGRVYVYRILSPCRATLSVELRGVAWEIDQLAGPANRPVPRETRDAVQRWLEQAPHNHRPEELGAAAWQAMLPGFDRDPEGLALIPT